MTLSKKFFLLNCFFVAGIFLSSFFKISIAFLLILFVFLLGFSFWKKKYFFFLFLFLALFLGILRFEFAERKFDSPLIKRFENQKVIFQGQIISEPKIEEKYQRFFLKLLIFSCYTSSNDTFCIFIKNLSCLFVFALFV